MMTGKLMMSRMMTRLNKYIASSGLSSRREADRLIEAGRVTVNGSIAKTGMTVVPGDLVKVDGKKVRPIAEENKIYIALHKPKNITTTTDLRRRDNIITFLNYPERVFPVGRLDRDSEGLILLTNDGDIVNRILRAEYGHEKEYRVEVDKDVDRAMFEKLESGIELDGKMTLPAKVRPAGRTCFYITLKQGLNRQIRRMCAAVGLTVIRLVRTRLMHITLGSLKEGSWRYLTQKEIAELHRLTDKAIARVKREQTEKP
jgi:23S rRNA pseudouridine2604 synthase